MTKNQKSASTDLESLRFTVHSAPPSTNPRARRRVYIAANTLRNCKVGAGDLITIKGNKNAIGIAWPSFTLDPQYIQLDSLLCENAHIRIGDSTTLQRFNGSTIQLKTAGFNLLDAKRLSSDTIFSLYLKEILVDIKYFTYESVVELQYQGVKRRLLLQKPEEDAQLYIITRETEISIRQEQARSKKDVDVGYDMVGGLEAEIEIIKDMIELPLLQPQVFGRFGLRAPKGVLLHGPPGTGKTLLARAVAASTNAHVITINGPEIVGKYYGETEAKLRDIFNDAEKQSPSIIFIDEIDALCPKRQDSSNQVEQRIVATLLTLMDGMGSSSSRVVVLASTNRPNAIDEALRRPGRFDREVEVGIPDAEARLSILKVLMRNMPHSLTGDDIKSIADRTHGYVGADLSSMCQTAALSAIKRERHSKQSTTSIVSLEDMEQALATTRPSAMREIIMESPNVYWKDIGGQETVKQRLKEAIEWPLLHPEAFRRLGVDAPKGMLLYGPPGCSKTLTAKALATESGLNFIAVKGPELFNKYVGESERAVREIFRKARAASPSIIFFDEIDAMTMARGGEDGVGDRVLAALLNEMDGVEPLKNVTVLAATNRPDVIDSALMRPGRLDRILYVGPPDLVAREQILRIRLGKMSIGEDVDIIDLAHKTDGCSGAEVVSLCQDAGLEALNESLSSTHVMNRHFIKALSSLQRRITPEMIASYIAYQAKSGVKSVNM